MSSIPRNPAPLSQLHEPTKDGLPDENTQNNCGETALAWVIRDIGNEPDADGDEIKDEVLGQGSTGGSDLRANGSVNTKYFASAQKRGVQLSLFTGTQAQLVAKCHQVLSLPAGDVLANFGGGGNYLHQFSDPAHYNGYGHICVIGHTVNGGLQLMDPWIGGWRTYTDAEVAKMLVWGYIVIATPLASAVPSPVPQGGSSSVSFVVPQGWSDDGKTMRAPDGTPVIGAMRLFVGDPNNHWDPSDTPVGPEQQVSEVELGNPQLDHQGVVQFFVKSGQLSWDGSFAGGAAWRTWNGQEESALRARIASLASSVQALHDANASLASQVQAAQSAAVANQAAARVLSDLKDALDQMGVQHG